MKKINCKAQSTLEYAVLIACVVGALLAMQIYLKRAYEGKVSSSVDQIGDQFDAKSTSKESTSTRTGHVYQEVEDGLKTTQTLEMKEQITRSHENVASEPVTP